MNYCIPRFWLVFICNPLIKSDLFINYLLIINSGINKYRLSWCTIKFSQHKFERNVSQSSRIIKVLSLWQTGVANLVLICCWIRENLLECAEQWQLEQHGWSLEVCSYTVKHLNDGMVCCFLVLFVIFQQPAIWLENSRSGKSRKQGRTSYNSWLTVCTLCNEKQKNKKQGEKKWNEKIWNKTKWQIP